MPNTPNLLPYPVLGGANNPPADIQALAVAVDSRYGLAVANWAALAAIITPFAGMRVWVTALGGYAVYTGSAWRLDSVLTAVKSAPETVNANTTLQNDDHLVLPILVAGTFIVEAVLVGASSANAGGDIRVGATWPTATVHQFGAAADPGLASGSVQTAEWKANTGATSGATATSYGLSTNNTTILARWIVIATAAGNFQMQWAQVTASGSSTLQAGSHMTLRQAA